MRNAFFRFAQQIVNSVFILSLREAFISLLPYLVVLAASTLVLASIDTFALFSKQSHVYQLILIARDIVQTLFPLAAVIAISFYTAQNIGLNTLAACVLAVACFVTNSGYLVHADNGIFLDTQGATSYAILIPVASTYFLKYLSQASMFNIIQDRFVNAFLIRHINLILPFFLAFCAVFIVAYLLTGVASSVLSNFSSDDSDNSVAGSLMRWHILVHVLWLLGVHGANVAGSIIDTGFMQADILPGITAQNFANAFMFVGGCGAVWGIFFSILLFGKDEYLKQIAKLSITFQIFNISELLLYGIPIVLNPYFAIPFLLCPIINFTLAYTAIDSGLITVVSTPVSWMTPALVSGYFVGGGNITVVLFQALLIAINVLIYAPFVRMYSSSNSEQVMFDQLSSRLSVASEIQTQGGERHIAGQSGLLNANQRLKQIVDDITAGELLLYYQPKMDVNARCYGFEALLRFKRPDGVIVPPYFLEHLEKAGFTDIIDWWVLDKVVDDLELWKKRDFTPRISINLNPSILTDSSLINKLVQSFSPYKGQIEIEIVEASYIRNFARIRRNIERLKQYSINTAIDDFGTGYSSLSLLYKLNATTIKLDKSILDNIDSPKGKVLYHQLCNLCKNLGFMLVAEGVETKLQAQFVSLAGVDFIQGAYYAKALPADEAREFALKYMVEPA